MEFKTADDEIMLSDGRVINIPLAVETYKEEQEKPNTKKIKVDKTPNIGGSSAGAGSDFFDIYRKQRSDELNRTKEMEEKWKEYTANKLFQEKRKAKFEYMENKNFKKKKKRLIKKQKLKEMKKELKKQKKNLSKTGDSFQKEEYSHDSCNDSKDNAMGFGRNPSSEKEEKPEFTHMPIQTKEKKEHTETTNSKKTHDDNDMPKKKKANGKNATDNEDDENESSEQGEISPVDTKNFLVIKEEEEIF